MIIDRRALLGGVAAAYASPAFAQTTQTRPFLMGVKRCPPDLTTEAVAAVDRFIATECDMAAPMILGGVPWTKAHDDAPFSEALNRDLAYQAPSGRKMLLSNAGPDRRFEHLAQIVGVARAAVAGLREGRVIGNSILNAEPARPAIGEIKRDLLA